MQTFQQTLLSLHRRRQLGRFLVVILLLAVVYGLVMLGLGFADYHFALSPRFRLNAAILLWSGLGLAALFAGLRILRTPLTSTAALADRALSDERRSSLSATYLSQKTAETPMEEFHLKRALVEASAQLGKIPFRDKIPTRALGVFAAVCALIGGVIFALKSSAPEPFDIVSTRLLSPNSDTAPYSPLRFQITPEQPTAIYQGEVTVQVEITGGEIEEDVVCLIRDPATGIIQEATTFREKLGRYARKFENSLKPLEIAFATGIARSDWRSLDILYQPRISNAEVLITPPPYTGRPASRYPLEAGEIRALEGSTISLKITSNRPLIGGTMTLQSLDQGEESATETVKATVDSEKEATFTWTAHRSAKISALIQDIRYTPADKPLELTLKSIPDQAPLVTINQPQAMVLATPNSTIPMDGDIEDDHGLAKVSLTRTLVGYRDRSQALEEGLSDKNYRFNSPLELAKLGVEPGQTLQFYLEAADRNPSLLGVGISDLVRVQIISEEDYAERIRSQLKLKEFTARYRALAEAIRQSRESLEELSQAKTPAEKEAARKKAAETHARAQELSQKIAQDFKAFDMEGRLKEAAQNAADTLSANLAQLAKFPADPEEQKAAIEEMKERLGGSAKQAEEIQQDAELVKKVGDVLEMAAEYRRLVNAQKSIIQRIKEITDAAARGNMELKDRLPGLAKTQQKNREALERFASDLEKRAAALPEEAIKMKADVAAFLEKMTDLDIPDPMNAASEAADNGLSVDALRRANLALQLLERLIEDPDNGF